MDLGVIAMKRYSIFPKAPVKEPHHQRQFTAITRAHVRGGGLTYPSAEVQSAYSVAQNNRAVLRTSKEF